MELVRVAGEGTRGPRLRPWCGWGGEAAGAARGETVQEPEAGPTTAQLGRAPMQEQCHPTGNGSASRFQPCPPALSTK